MSAPIAEAKIELPVAAKRSLNYDEAAQLIADSEAKAILEMETGRIKKLVHAFQTEKQERARAELERDQLKAEVGHLHGRVGLFAKAHFGINDNLLTDETFAQMSHALQTERAGLAIEEENANARAERAEAELAKERARFWWAVTHPEDFNQIVDALKWGPCRDKNTAITYAAIDAGHAGGRK
jgi:hypothetical protein